LSAVRRVACIVLVAAVTLGGCHAEMSPEPRALGGVRLQRERAAAADHRVLIVSDAGFAEECAYEAGVWTRDGGRERVAEDVEAAPGGEVVRLKFTVLRMPPAREAVLVVPLDAADGTRRELFVNGARFEAMRGVREATIALGRDEATRIEVRRASGG
jgi:Fe2+ transport system protein FeoA